MGITDLESAPAEVSVTPMDGCDVEVYTTTREIKLPEESSFSVMSDGEPDSKIYATTSVAVPQIRKLSGILQLPLQYTGVIISVCLMTSWVHLVNGFHMKTPTRGNTLQ